MKKVLLGILFCAVGTVAFGQRVLAPVEGYIVDPTVKPHAVKNTQKSGKKDEVSAWYNYMDAANALGMADYRFFSNSTIWPDSLVKQIYGSTGGGTELGYVGTHGAGQVFDPKSTYFDNGDLGTMPLTKYNPYRWDSVALFISNYKQFIPNSVDTLIFYFFTSKNTGVTKQTLTFNTGQKEASANVKYNYRLNSGAGHISSFKYLLTSDDTTSTFRAITVPTNGETGISVAGDGLAAFTISYRPGFAYELGDTVDEAWTDNAITKKLNHLEIGFARETAKNEHESYNHGLRLYREMRYNKSTNGWNGQYYPGDGILADGNEHLYSSFYITSTNVGTNDVAFKGYGIGNVYPNPASGSANVQFDLGKSENVNITLYNALGQKINTVAEGNYAAGTHNVNFSVENLNSGVYFYTINAGGYTKTMKFTVAK